MGVYEFDGGETNCRETCPGCGPFEEVLTTNDGRSERGSIPGGAGLGYGFAVSGQRPQVQRPALQWQAVVQATDMMCELRVVS